MFLSSSITVMGLAARLIIFYLEQKDQIHNAKEVRKILHPHCTILRFHIYHILELH
jgi:hypothetical protein